MLGGSEGPHRTGDIFSRDRQFSWGSQHAHLDTFSVEQNPHSAVFSSFLSAMRLSTIPQTRHRSLEAKPRLGALQ